MINWTDPNPVFFDLETQSAADLRAVGGRLYALDPTTRVLSAVFYVDGVYHVWVPGYFKLKTLPNPVALWPKELGPAQLIELHHGDALPFPVRRAATLGYAFVAHNCFGFDRYIWRHCLMPRCPGLVEPAWADTIPLARAAGLRGSLDAVAKDLVGTGKDRGKRILMKHIHATVEGSHVKYSSPGAGDLEVILRYNVADVDLLRRAWEALSDVPVEADVIEAHDAVNDRGVKVDTALAAKLVSVSSKSVSRAADRIKELTGGVLHSGNLRSTKQVNEWLDAHGLRIRDYSGKRTLRKDFVTQAIANPWTMLGEDAPAAAVADIDPAVFEVLRLRSAALRITGAKGDRAVMRAGSDGRARDLFTYWQAHTGRWSSAGIQVHNLPRPRKGVPVDELLAMHDSGAWGTDPAAAYDAIAAKLPGKLSVDDAISSLLRPLFTAADGKALVICDYAAVECRGVAWIAGEETLLQTLASGGDVYKEMAARIFGAPATEVTDQQRQVGKVTVLGCIAEGTPVLTQRGWVEIQYVRQGDELWDGSEWVPHEGVVPTGIKPCIEVNGVWLTRDHEILTRDGWAPAETVATRYPVPELPAALRAGSEPPDTRAARKIGAGWMKQHFDAFAPSPGRSCSVARTRKHQTTHDTAGGASLSSRDGSMTRSGWYGISHSFPGTTYPGCRSIVVTTAGDTSRATSGSLLVATNRSTADALASWSIKANTWPSANSSPGSAHTSLTPPRYTVSTPGGRSTRYVRTFDILNAGLRHRFQVGGMIVSNCSYSMSAEKFRLYCGLQGIDLAAAGTTAELCVEAFRGAHQKIAGTYAGSIDGKPYRSGGVWSQLARAAMAATAEGGVHSAGRTTWVHDRKSLICTLPSGRQLRYRGARVEDRIPGYARALGIDRPKATLVYEGAYGEQTLYGGKITENVVQAICRDLLATALVQCERAGLPVVLHVHDELVCEVPVSSAAESLNTLATIMATPPDWAQGFPVAVEGFAAPRYLKAAPKGWPHVKM